MPVTKKQISDSVLYKLAGGVPPTAFPVNERDIWPAIDRTVNAMFKLKHFDTTLPSGETIPENTMIATYENVAVTSLNERSVSTLPVTPISLPKNVGIFLIYDPAYPDVPFIPLQRGQRGLLRTDTLLNDTLGLISYEPKNNQIVYSKDLTMFGVTAVTMELCVFDMAQYGVTDNLPIPSDYVDMLEDELVKEFAPVLPKSGFVSNFTNPTQIPPKQ